MKNKTDAALDGLLLCLNNLGGKWKPIILYKISKGTNRFNKLFAEIEGINRQMLSKQLKELEKSGILERKLFAEIPPRVEYSLTVFGKSLVPVIQHMSKWGIKNQQFVNKPSPSKKSESAQLPLFD
ncbi:MAG: helix-turn-helix domain-containing protein [Maribacter sp.]